jgi:hypothetical protein
VIALVLSTGASAEAAQQVVTTLAATPTSAVASLGIAGLELPLAGLLGRPGVPALQCLDLSQVSYCGLQPAKLHATSCAVIAFLLLPSLVLMKRRFFHHHR